MNKNICVSSDIVLIFIVYSTLAKDVFRIDLSAQRLNLVTLMDVPPLAFFQISLEKLENTR